MTLNWILITRSSSRTPAAVPPAMIPAPTTTIIRITIAMIQAAPMEPILQLLHRQTTPALRVLRNKTAAKRIPMHRIKATRVQIMPAIQTRTAPAQMQEAASIITPALLAPAAPLPDKADRIPALPDPAAQAPALAALTQAPAVLTQAPVDRILDPVVLTPDPAVLTRAPVVLTQAPAVLTQAPVVLTAQTLKTLCLRRVPSSSNKKAVSYRIKYLPKNYISIQNE